MANVKQIVIKSDGLQKEFGSDDVLLYPKASVAPVENPSTGNSFLYLLEDGFYEKNSAGISTKLNNMTFGTTVGTVAQGNDSRINNGQTAFGWGNHASAGYLTSYTDTNTTYTGSLGITLLGTDFRPNYGNAANTITQGNDSRLSDARTPLSHTHTKAQITDFAHTHSEYYGFVSIGSTNTNADSHTLGAGLNTTGNGTGNTNFPTAYGTIMTMQDASNYAVPQFHVQSEGTFSVRTKWSTAWSGWRTMRDNINFLSGTGSANWTAGNDGRLSDARTPLAHTHEYLPLAGGTLTGNLTLNSGKVLYHNLPDNTAGGQVDYRVGNWLHQYAKTYATNAATRWGEQWWDGAAYHLAWASSAGFNFGSALNGTSASFSSSVAATSYFSSTGYVALRTGIDDRSAGVPWYGLGYPGGAVVTNLSGYFGVRINTAVGSTLFGQDGVTSFPSSINSTKLGNTYNIDPHANGVNLHSTANIAPHYQTNYTWYTGAIGSGTQRASLDNVGNFSANSFSGTGTGLTGTAASLNIGGTSARTNFINTDSRLTYGESGMQYFNLFNVVGASPTLNQTPDGNWWHIIRMNHGNNTGYYADLAVGMTTSNAEVRVRRISNGAGTPWVTLIDNNTIGSQSVAYATNALINTTFNGEYPMVVNVSGTLYSHATVKFNGASGELTAPIFKGALNGNATTANTLETARTINGVSFNGSANITVADNTKLPLAGGSLSGDLTIQSGMATYWNLVGNTVGGRADFRTGNWLHQYVKTYSGGAASRWGEQWYDGASYHQAWAATSGFNFGSTLTAPAFYGPSDIRLKTLVDKVHTSSVSNIEEISYLWKDKSKGEDIQVGYSAQEVQKVMPNAVNTDDKGFLSVNYIQVLVAKVAELEKRLKQLEYGI